MDSSDRKKVNFHTHCYRCRHAKGTVGEYADEALRKGYDVLGFSDHLPFPDDPFDQLRMSYAEIEDYLEEVTELKKDLETELQILRGFEGEYVREYEKYYERLLSHEKCDYLILGQHLLETKEGELFNVYQLKDTSLYEEYAENIVEAMRTGYYRYAAHPDLVFYNDNAWDIHCDRACDILIDGAVRYGFALEYNANGLRREKKRYVDGERYPYPHKKLWDRVEGSGIQVYVGSDCHDPVFLDDPYMEMAYADLARLGIAVCTEI